MQDETVPSGENTKGELGGYEKTDVAEQRPYSQ